MLIHLIIWADKIRFWIPTGVLSLSMIPFATMSIPMSILPRRLWIWMDNYLYTGYLRLTLFIFEGVSDVEINLYGDVAELRDHRESAIVISNHQSNVDWAIITMLSSRQSKEGFEFGLRFVVKSAIHFVPLFGWYIFQHGYIYVRRFGQFVPDPLLRQFAYLRMLEEPFWLHIFPEGTRFTKKKPQLIEQSQKHARESGVAAPEFTLFPRVGAFSLAVKELKPSLDAIYDITIGYGQTRLPGRTGLAPNMFEFVSGVGKGKQVHVHIKRFAAADIPTEKQAVKQWLLDRFAAKEEYMKQFYETGAFPELYEKKASKISLSRTIIPFLGFTGAIILPIFSEKVRKAYLLTIASSPLLILWLHLRKCV